MVTSVGKLLGIPENRRSYNESSVVVLAKCLTGLEFEAENVKVDLPHGDSESGFWKAEKDNSLRGHAMEFVLREPLFGEDLVNSFKWLCKWATDNNFEVNYRTGLHVHIDVRNLEANQLVSMLVYYALFEPVLFKWIGDEREGSIFCMPFYKAESGIEDVIRAFKSPSRMKDYAAKIDRYGALNLNALAKYGSVEWRHMQTTFDFERILKWVNIAQAFKKYAKHNPLNPQELLAELSKIGPSALFHKIVGDRAFDLWDYDSENKVWGVGLPIAQEMAVLLDDSRTAKWDATRELLKPASNNGLTRWAAKVKAKKEKDFEEVPDNIFTHPELLTSHVIQTQALDQLREMVKHELGNIVFTPS